MTDAPPGLVTFRVEVCTELAMMNFAVIVVLVTCVIVMLIVPPLILTTDCPAAGQQVYQPSVALNVLIDKTS